MGDLEAVPNDVDGVTVVIPTRNRAAFLPAVIDALKAQTHAAFRVVVIDDGSTDGTAEVARASFGGDPRFDVVSIENKGPATARNVGCLRATTPWLAFTDDDCFPQPTWLEAMLAAARETGADILQGTTISDPSVRRSDLPWFARGKEVHRVWRFQTCNLLVRTDRFRDVGGFDESFKYPVGEDIDFGVRLVRSGGVAAFARDAVVHHRLMPMSYVQFLRRRWQWAQIVRLVAVNPDARVAFPHRYVGHRSHAALWAMLPIAAWSLQRGWWLVPVAGGAAFVLHRAYLTRAEGLPLAVRLARAPLELVGVAVEAAGFAVESARHRTVLI